MAPTSALLVALGLLCSHVAASAVSAASESGSGANGQEAVLQRMRDYMASAAASKPLFEDALAATFAGTDSAAQQAATLAQLAQLVEWLEAHPQPSDTDAAFLPERRSPAAQALATAALRLYRANAKDVAATLSALREAGKALSGAVSWRGYPAARRLLIGAILKKRADFGAAFPAELQPAVDDVLLLLFALHRTSAAKRGAVQFFHVSKSGGTNMCQSAEANGCTSQVSPASAPACLPCSHM
jgi:hypothetical protein